MKGLLQVGFYNFVTVDNVLAILDYRLSTAKKIVKSAREERPRSVIDVSKGRKCMSLIILKGNTYIISTIPRITLAKRLGAVEVEAEELITIKPKNNLQLPNDTLDA